MTRAIYPGSFDPVTFGHLDIIRRSAKIVDELIVGVLNNTSKVSLFSVSEREEMLKEVTRSLPNVTIASFSGLLVDFARRERATAIVRGLRAITDFDYELQMAQTNHILDEDIDTLFFTTGLEYAYLSSSTVKEVAAFGGDIRKFVPDIVVKNMKHKFQIT